MLTSESVGLKLSEMNIGPSLQADGFLFHPCKFLKLKVGGTEHGKIMIARISKRLKNPEKIVQVLGSG